MNSIHNNQTIIKFFYIAGISISILFLFAISQHTAQSHAGVFEIDHCIDYASGEILPHTHPAAPKEGPPPSPICGGTITYALNNFYEGATLFSVLLQTLVGIVVTAAFFYFFWNLVKYIRDEEEKETAKTRMGYSLAAIFVIVTLWGIIGFVRGVLGINAGKATNSIDLPTTNFIKSGGIIIEETIKQKEE